jgi:hypothetical protein
MGARKLMNWVTILKPILNLILKLILKLRRRRRRGDGNNYTKVMVNVTPFAVDATSDQIKLTKNGTHNTFHNPQSSLQHLLLPG